MSGALIYGNVGRALDMKVPARISGPMSALIIGLLLAGNGYGRTKLVGAWLFDEGDGDTVTDATGSRNDGDIRDGAEWSDEGQFGSALSFDGSQGSVIFKPTSGLSHDGRRRTKWHDYVP